MLYAGTAVNEITPERGEELAGYPHYPRNNTGVHDPLYATCMYLNNGTEEVAMVTLDLLFFSKKHAAEARRRIRKNCGIPEKHVMISCSHTHSGPWASGRLDLESIEAGKKQNPDYIAFVVGKVVDAVCRAKREAVVAEYTACLGMCGAESGVGGNRRFPGGPHDPLVSVQATRDKSGKLLCIMVNYTLHPTFIHEWSTVVTADYPCYLRMELKERAPGAAVGFAQGASGNQSSRYYRQGESYDEAERVGRTLGRAAWAALEKAQWRDALEIGVADTEIPLELRTFDSEDVLEARAERATRRYQELYARYGQSRNRDEYYLWQNANLKMLGAEDQLGYARMQKKGVKIELLEDEQPVEIQVFRLGDTCVIGCQGEIFVEYALYVKAMAGFGIVVFNELANGCLPGYLYTPESLIDGGYETDTSMLGEQFGRHLVERVLEAIDKVKPNTL